jgi:hypothetical protein
LGGSGVLCRSHRRPFFGGRPIKYHGGPVTLGTTHAYAIWYGNWTAGAYPATPGLMASFLGNDGGSPYFNINTTYNNGTTAVTNSVAFGGAAFIGYDNGKTTLSDADVANEVTKTIAAGKLANQTTPSANTAPDPNGVYFLFTSSDRSMSSCAGQTASSPNGNVAGDAMVNVTALELEEAVTDPQLDAWYDNAGNENADKCAWKFGTTYTASNGSKASMKLNDGHDYYIQQNWLNVGNGSCALAH